jgi:hypothetical protein
MVGRRDGSEFLTAVIARSESDEAIQPLFLGAKSWIASLRSQ